PVAWDWMGPVTFSSLNHPSFQGEAPEPISKSPPLTWIGPVIVPPERGRKDPPPPPPPPPAKSKVVQAWVVSFHKHQTLPALWAKPPYPAAGVFSPAQAA